MSLGLRFSSFSRDTLCLLPSLPRACPLHPQNPSPHCHLGPDHRRPLRAVLPSSKLAAYVRLNECRRLQLCLRLTRSLFFLRRDARSFQPSRLQPPPLPPKHPPPSTHLNADNGSTKCTVILSRRRSANARLNERRRVFARAFLRLHSRRSRLRCCRLSRQSRRLERTPLPPQEPASRCHLGADHRGALAHVPTAIHHTPRLRLNERRRVIFRLGRRRRRRLGRGALSLQASLLRPRAPQAHQPPLDGHLRVDHGDLLR